MSITLDLDPFYVWIVVLIMFAVIGIGYNVYVKKSCGEFKDKNVSKFVPFPEHYTKIKYHIKGKSRRQNNSYNWL